MLTTGDRLPEGDLGADVVIVGAGVNGLLLADALQRARKSVVVIEAGDDGPGVVAESRATGLPFDGANAGRRLGYGGTGRWWAGQCAPLDPIDLEFRSWIPASGWPISWSELSRWHTPAAAALGIAQETFTSEQWRRRRIAPTKNDAIEPKFSVFLPEPDVGKTLRPVLKASSTTRVILSSPVVDILQEDTASGRVTGVLVDTGGRRRRIAAPIVVLAAGGIETARLLLNSGTTGRGVANVEGNVGRYLHDHPSGIAARVEVTDIRRMVDLYGMLYRRMALTRLRSWARLPLSPEVQRREGLVNATSNLVFDDDTLAPLKELVRRSRGPQGTHGRAGLTPLLGGAMAALPSAAAVVRRRYGHGLSPVPPGGNVWLRTASEQPPRTASRVTLSEHRDIRGQRLAEIHWQLGDEERRAQAALVQQLGAAWQGEGMATLHPLPWLQGGDGWERHQADAYHHSGTARMSATPRTGVVDTDLQCHEVPGLYVAGSAVFPTSGNSNPTFTSVALTLRLASHLTGAG